VFNAEKQMQMYNREWKTGNEEPVNVAGHIGSPVSNSRFPVPGFPFVLFDAIGAAADSGTLITARSRLASLNCGICGSLS
jgi:hypothetical protein